MSFIAILGAGATGGALAQKLACRDRVRDVRLIDPDVDVARGKALDILQSAPVDGFTTRVSAAADLAAAAGAAAIVIADSAKGSVEHGGEPGLATLRRLIALDDPDAAAPLIFAGAAQRELMARAASELHVPARRLIGSAPAALQSAVRALVGLELDGSGVEVQVAVVGVPPHAAVIAWEEATVFGQPISAHVPPHRLAAISGLLPRLWPPGPYALASAAARVAEAVVNGSRRRFCCFVALAEAPARGVVAAMPAAVGPRGIERVVQPALTRQERTQLDNAIS